MCTNRCPSSPHDYYQMFSSLLYFFSDQFQIHLKTLLIVLILQLVLCTKLNTNEELLEQTRAIGGESLDTSNFVLYIDENKARFIEVPYEFMKQRIQDQKMWRRWSIMLSVLCFVFLVILIAYLIHNFRTLTGPFSLCRKNVNENQSDDKINSSHTIDYTQTNNLSMYKTAIDPRQVVSFQTIHDEEYLSQQGPFGLIHFEKNDTYIDWVRIPEENYKQWIYALKFWRTCSIAIGLLSFVFAALVLAYVIHGFRTNSAGPFSCLGEDVSNEKLDLSPGNIPANLQQLALQHQLRLAQQQEQDAQRQKYEAERRLSAMYRNPTTSALLTTQTPIKT
ncbi:unnamed protein product [Adineta ricciae]|uniref:Uncharacterized protein n=1 Tax=Adineta ricciae TaxID=249248 RepID=A0A813PJZ5_ADIRI|nr:unnamed protein product [Adineta ricciae]